jgi:hypothetical protein
MVQKQKKIYFQATVDPTSKEPRIGRPGIRSYVRETGIFFPDSLLLDPVWRDSDPFACFLDHDSTQIFTELLPSHIEGSAALQKFIPMLPSGTRENEAVAFQTDRPDWMSSDNFSAFAGLRAHPHTQFRSFVDAISLDRLPFDNPCVHVLIKQAMFHFGHESWKTDTTSKWNGLNVLFHELQSKLAFFRRRRLTGALFSFLEWIVRSMGSFTQNCSCWHLITQKHCNILQQRPRLTGTLMHPFHLSTIASKDGFLALHVFAILLGE